MLWLVDIVEWGLCGRAGCRVAWDGGGGDGFILMTNVKK